MQIDRQESKESIVFSLKEKLSFKDHTLFNEIVSSLETEKRRIVFDLSKLEMIDSAGIGMLFLAQKIVSRNGGTMTIRNPQGQVKRVFDITSIDRQIKVVTSEE